MNMDVVKSVAIPAESDFFASAVLKPVPFVPPKPTTISSIRPDSSNTVVLCGYVLTSN